MGLATGLLFCDSIICFFGEAVYCLMEGARDLLLDWSPPGRLEEDLCILAGTLILLLLSRPISLSRRSLPSRELVLELLRYFFSSIWRLRLPYLTIYLQVFLPCLSSILFSWGSPSLYFFLTQFLSVTLSSGLIWYLRKHLSIKLLMRDSSDGA